MGTSSRGPSGPAPGGQGPELTKQLDQAGVACTSVDIGQDREATQHVMQVNGGNRTVPTVVFAGGTALTNPGLEDVLARVGG